MTLTICSIFYLPKCIVYNTSKITANVIFFNLSNCKTFDNTNYKSKCVQKHFNDIILLFQLVLGFLSILSRLSYSLFLLSVSLCFFSLSLPVHYSYAEVYFCKTQVPYRHPKAKTLLSWAELFQWPRYWSIMCTSGWHRGTCKWL